MTDVGNATPRDPPENSSSNQQISKSNNGPPFLNKILPEVLVQITSTTSASIEKPNHGDENSRFKIKDSPTSNNEATFLTPLAYNRRKSINVLESNLRRHTIHKKFQSWMIPAETAANVKMFGGKRAVQEEQKRSRLAGWVIHPCSSLRYYWDLIIMLVLIVNLVVLPLNIAFFTVNSMSSWIIFHSISDGLFLFDIILNFRTGYRESNDGYRILFVLDPKLIAKRYAKSWLALDVISSFPIDNILIAISGNSNDLSLGVKSASRAFKFLRLAKFLSLLKLLRLSRVLRYIAKFEEFYHVTASVMRYIKLVLMMLLVAHWNGCLGFLVPMMQDFPEHSWVALNELQNAHWTEQYGWALFKALSHMLCIGYGRFIPMLLSEACITIFSMVTGATFYALFIAHSMAYIQQSDSARRLYQEKFQQIEEYMSYRNLPTATRERITDYYEHKYTQKRLFDENEILSEISKPIRQDIVNHNCRDLIESVPFLKEGGCEFINLIISKLSFDVYLPGDAVIKEGTIGYEMYFIRHGVVDVILEDQLVATLTEGDYFGEITMLTNARRVASVKAATVCDLFMLSRENLYYALAEFPEMRYLMEHVALDRLIKLRQKFPDCINTMDAAEDLINRQGNQKSSSSSINPKYSLINATSYKSVVNQTTSVSNQTEIPKVAMVTDDCETGCTCALCTNEHIFT